MIQFLKKCGKRKVGLAIFALLLLIGNIFIIHDEFLYDMPIMKITHVDEEVTNEVTGPNGEVEKHYTQTLTGAIQNGEYKGQSVTYDNKYTYSKVVTTKYYKGERVFVNIKETGDECKVSISGEKRDVYVAFLFSALLFLLIAVSGFRGGRTMLSLGANIVIVIGTFYFYENGSNILHLCIGMLLLFGICSLLLANGFNKQTIGAIVISIITVVILFLTYQTVLACSEEPEYMMQEYISGVVDLPEMFLAGTLIGGFGAILDVAISMTTAIHELVEKTKDITNKQMFSSMKEIAYDIMGTMINVLFFTYLAGAIPMFVLQLKNGYALGILLELYLTFEVMRFLVGAIGIVLAIPISWGVSFLLYGRKKVRVS